MVKLYRTGNGCIAERNGEARRLPAFSFDKLFRQSDPVAAADEAWKKGEPCDSPDPERDGFSPPLETQEVWAAGVTYLRSREARMEESESTGGDVFYDLVYDAERPELFFKATARRVRGHLEAIRVRSDSTWDVPEPELTLALNPEGRIFGFTVGNDVSSRSIEGENPLYLPQAKVYRGSCALGPCLSVAASLPVETGIHLIIRRDGTVAFEGSTHLDQLKRPLEELASFLFRENEFPDGALLMTGTGVVPSSGFSLRSGDEVAISIDGIGTLRNTVE